MLTGKGGGKIIVAISEEYAQFIRDVTRPVGLAQAASQTGISEAYISRMLQGHVPSSKINARFARGFDLSPDQTQRLFQLAGNVNDEVVASEDLIQTACGAAIRPHPERAEWHDALSPPARLDRGCIAVRCWTPNLRSERTAHSRH